MLSDNHVAHIDPPAARWSTIPLRYGAALSLGLLLVSIWPVLLGGPYGDDALNVATRGYIVLKFGSLWNLIYAYTTGWITIQGRIYPLAFAITNTIWYLANGHEMVAKAINLAILFLALGSFYTLIVRLSGRRVLGFFFLLAFSVCLQTRAWYDPNTQFPGLITSVLLLTALQAIFLCRFLEKGSLVNLAVSVFLFTAALLTYELAIVAIPVNVLVAYSACRNEWRRYWAIAPHLALFALYAGIVLLIRPTEVSYPGIAVGLSANTFRSLAINLYGALPLTYRVSDPTGVFAAAAPLAWHLHLIALGIAIGFFALWISAFTAPRHEAWTANDGLVVGLGIALWIVPAGILALSKRYSVVVGQFGLAYIQVLVESFGVAMILAVAIDNGRGLLRRNRRAAAIAFSLLAAAIPGLSFQYNIINGRAMDANFLAPERRLFVATMEAGILDDVPDEASLILDPVVWAIPELVTMHTGRTFAGVYTYGSPEAEKASAPRFRVYYRVTGANAGVTLSAMGDDHTEKAVRFFPLSTGRVSSDPK